MSLAKQVTLADTLARTVGSKVSTAEEAARILGMAMPLAGENEGFFVLPLDAECHVLSEPILVALGNREGNEGNRADNHADNADNRAHG